MEEITIDATGQNGIIVHAGRMKKAHLKWYANGLHIYLLGAMTRKNRDTLNHTAIQECRSRHIPAISLLMKLGETEKSKKPDSEFLRSLFDGMVNDGYEVDEE